jgi:hypothetical protein
VVANNSGSRITGGAQGLRASGLTKTDIVLGQADAQRSAGAAVYFLQYCRHYCLLSRLLYCGMKTMPVT